MANQLTPEQAIRLLRAKTAILEQRVLDEVASHGGVLRPVTELAADIALLASIMADHIVRSLPSQEVTSALQRLASGEHDGETP